MAKLGDFLKSVNQSKINIMDKDTLTEGEYIPFVMNRTLSYFVDTVMYANEINTKSHVDNKLQYDFLLNSLRKKKRFSPWLRQDKVKDLDYVKRYYGYSNEKAKQALKILTEEQLNFIKSKFETGGKK